MNAFFADSVIYALLVIGVVFAGLGLMGLLIFPDIRSRMFTASRATLISCGAIVCAGIIYGLFHFFTGDGDQYAAFAGCVGVLFVIIIILNQLAAREIQRHIPALNRPVNPGATEPADSFCTADEE